jgi:hypothetical protein
MLDRFPLKPNPNTIYGDKVLTILQDNSSSLVDLLVRESIQNSLDAGLNHDNSPINISFSHGKFDKGHLLSNLGNNISHPDLSDQFLEIRDSNTQGLSGEAGFHENLNLNNMGNFLKLVMNLGVNQTQEGAGGSWGLGKTIFYRAGKGLVIYYSRFKQTDNTYQERLILCWVENQNLENGYLRTYFNTYTGVCWWGKNINNNIYPITSPDEIRIFLNIFGLSPYKDAETGTSVIIPFIDFDIFNANNLKFSILKWYTPRLCINTWNESKKILTAGNALECKIIEINNNVKINLRPAEIPFFKLINLLHYYSVTGNLNIPSDSLDLPPRENWKREAIKHYNSIFGYLSYVEVDRNHLQIINFGDPDSILGYMDEDAVMGNNEGGGYPLLCYSRKPGMTIKYHSKDNSWGLNQKVPPGKWLFAFFTVKSSDSNYEAYFRDCENANHMQWIHNTKHSNKYVNKLQKEIKRILDHSIQEPSAERVVEPAFQLRRQMADLFMPPIGFGNRATADDYEINNNRPFRKSVRRKNLKNSNITDYQVLYKEGKIHLIFSAKLEIKSKITLEIHAESNSEYLDYLRWISKQKEIKFPYTMESFIIRNVEIDDQIIDNQSCKSSFRIMPNKNLEKSIVTANFHIILIPNLSGMNFSLHINEA